MHDTSLLFCPFCGFKPDINDMDCIYPCSRPEFNEEKNEIHYRVYNLVCYETGGGCGASVLGDSPEACISLWNTRKF